MHPLGSVLMLRRYSYRHGAHSRIPSAGSVAGSRCLTARFFGAINFDSEFLARPEERDFLGIDADQLAGLGIAPLPRAPLLHRETAEAANLDPLTARQRVRHRVEHRIDYGLRLAMGEPLAARQQFFDDFPLGHRSRRRPPPRPGRSGSPFQLFLRPIAARRSPSSRSSLSSSFRISSIENRAASCSRLR